MRTGEARFAELYERHYPAVYRYCRRRTTAELADDAVADTFLTAWRKISDVPDGDETVPWLYSIAYRTLGHQWRSTGRQQRLRSKLDSIGQTNASGSVEEQIIMDEESALVLQALATLKRADQEILRLTVWEELPHRDIALVLGLSVSAVKKRASRARSALTSKFETMEKTTSPAARKGGAL